VRPQDAKARARGGGRSHERLRRERIGRRAIGRQASQARLHIAIGNALEFSDPRAFGTDSVQALLRVAAVLLEVRFDECFEELPVFGAQGIVLVKNLRQRPGLGEHPGVHGSNELVARDEVHLQRQNAKEKVMVGHGRPLLCHRSRDVARYRRR